MLKKKSFVKLMNILKSQSEKHEGMATAFSAMYNFVPEREAIMSRTDAECVILDLIGNNGEIIDWLKKEMNDQYEYIDWFISECDYGKSPKILYVPYRDLDEDKKLYNMYLVDTPAMVFDIITNPRFGTEDTVCLDNVRKYHNAFVYNDKTRQYTVAGLRHRNDGMECIMLVDGALNETIYTQRKNGVFVLDGESDDSEKFIEQMTNQIFVDNDKKTTLS